MSMDITIHGSLLPHDDPDASLDFWLGAFGCFGRVQAGGAEVVHEPVVQPYGVRHRGFRDPAGNLIRIRSCVEPSGGTRTAAWDLRCVQCVHAIARRLPRPLPHTSSPVGYWHVPDIEAKLAEVIAAGANVKEPAHVVGGGCLVATDPDGNVLGVFQDR